MQSFYLKSKGYLIFKRIEHKIYMKVIILLLSQAICKFLLEWGKSSLYIGVE